MNQTTPNIDMDMDSREMARTNQTSQTDATIRQVSHLPHRGDPIANARLAQKEYAEGKTTLASLPPMVTMALTTHCFPNKPCVICDRNTRPASADSEVNAKIIQAAKPLLETACIVFLHSGGEAMFSPLFDEVVASIRPPTKIHFATNAMALSQERADRMLQSGAMSNFVVSMDAATPEMFHIMRPACDFEKVTGNIKYYTKRAAELFGDEARGIILNMTLCAANIEEAPQFIDLAAKLGAKGITLNHLNGGLTHCVETSKGWNWDYKEQEKFQSTRRHDELILTAYERAKAQNIHIAFIGQPFLTQGMAEQHQDICSELGDYCWVVPEPFWSPWTSDTLKPFSPGLLPCLKPWQEVAIQPNGNVRRCCYHDERQWTLGNIAETDFMELWNSDDMIRYRKEFIEKSMSDICFSSSPCMHRGRE